MFYFQKNQINQTLAPLKQKNTRYEQTRRLLGK